MAHSISPVSDVRIVPSLSSHSTLDVELSWVPSRGMGQPAPFGPHPATTASDLPSLLIALFMVEHLSCSTLSRLTSPLVEGEE